MNTRIELRDMDWWKWGAASEYRSITDYPKLLRFLQKRFDQSLEETKPPSSHQNGISRDENVQFITNVFKTALPSVMMTTDQERRLKKALGKSYPDLLKIVTNQPVHLPDAVVSATDHNEVLEVLNVCSQYNIQVVPYGGGTNVVGALNMKAYERPRITLDMTRMKNLLHIDEVNHTAVFEAGIYGPEIESLLNAKGFSLGHFPQSFQYSSLGGWIATRSAGQESSGYGRIEEMVISVKVATPARTLTTSPFEGDAEGVNLKSLFFGSEGMLGVVTEAMVRIHTSPQTKKWLVAVFPAFQNGIEAIKDLIQKNIIPTVVRYSDPQETFIQSLFTKEDRSLLSKLKSSISKRLLKLKGMQTPSLLMMRFDGEKEECQWKTKVALQIFRHYNGFSAGTSLGKKWETSRFSLPYLRDALIERGIFVDTMETVLPWDQIDKFKQTVLTELQRSKAFGYERGILLAHLSHVYPTSSSIYCTVITAQDKENPQAQWEEIKNIVTNVIIKCGGALSHHHSVGRDHQPWYIAKTDALTREILRSVKRTIDPNHILNPGKLFDE